MKPLGSNHRLLRNHVDVKPVAARLTNSQPYKQWNALYRRLLKTGLFPHGLGDTGDCRAAGRAESSFGTAIGNQRVVSDTELRPDSLETDDLCNAPLELVAYGDGKDAVQYMMSFYNTPEFFYEDARPRFEEHVLESLSHTTVTGHLQKRFDEFYTGDLSDTTLRVFNVQPPKTTPHVDGSIPNPQPGESLLQIVSALDQLDGSWILQTLVAPNSYSFGISARQALKDDRSTAIQVNILTEDKQLDSGTGHPLQPLFNENVLQDLGLKLHEPGPKLLPAVKAAYMHKPATFSVPLTYTTGFSLPPGRLLSLKHGVGGTASGLETWPLGIIRHLVTGDRRLGYEAGVMTDAELNKYIQLSLPEAAGSTVHVETDKQRQERLHEDLPVALRSNDAPVIVLAANPDILFECGEIYVKRQSEQNGFDIQYPEHIKVEGLGEHVAPGNIATLNPWFEKLLSSDADLTLLNLDNLASPAETASNLLASLSSVGQRFTETTSGTRHATVFVFVPELAAATNDRRDAAEFAVRTASDAGLTLDIHASYPSENDQAAVQNIGTAADALLVDNAESSAALLNGTQLQPSQSTIAEQIETKSPALWNARIQPTYTNWPAIAMPIVKCSSLPTDEPHRTADLTTNQKEKLTNQLERLGTSSIPMAEEDHTTNPPSFVSDRSTQKSIQPRTTGLPPEVTYNSSRDCYECQACADGDDDPHRRDATYDGLRRIINCCHSLSAVDRAHVRAMRTPELKLTEQELSESALTERQFHFLKALYLVHTDEADHYFEFDSVFDSTVALRDDFNLDASDIEQLKTKGYITEDTTPHVLYTLTTAGRKALNEPWTAGTEFGPEQGELNETMQHKMMVRAASLSLQQKYDDHPGIHVKTYVPIEIETANGTETKNIDVAAVDRNETIIAAAEADRENNDRRDSNVDSYRKMTTADPETALYVVTSYDAASNLFDDFTKAAARGQINYNGPNYSPTTREYDVNEPGITDVKPIRPLLKELEPDWN
jgi:hypothetical protein